MLDIYEQIWNLPSSHVLVSRCDATGTPLNPAADVVLDEQAKAGGSMLIDNAPRLLIPFVRSGLFTESTFATLITLLDHYDVTEGVAEKPLSDPVHGPAVEAFLDAILPTPPMLLALNHIKATWEPTLTDAQFRAKVKSFWFEPFTNNFGHVVPHCVGFEHVFVGESTRKASDGPTDDNIGGYHSWVKYYLDESAGLVNNLGHDYRAAVMADGLADANIASVLLTWKPPVEVGGDGHVLFKKPGGFFVGTRPECEIALGTVGLYSGMNNDFDNTPEANTENHRRLVLGTNAFYLVCHPQSIQPPSAPGGRINGWHVRTLFAKFLGSATGTGPGTGTGTPGTGGHIPSNPHNDAAIRLRRALPNPPGASDDGEWVEIKNVSAFPITLDTWALADHLNRQQTLAGTIAPGEIKRITLVRVDANSMMLRNSASWILLYEGSVRRAAVQYTQPAESAVFEFDMS